MCTEKEGCSVFSPVVLFCHVQELKGCSYRGQGCFSVTIKSGITEGEETGEGGIKDKAGRGADGA